jgi:hypothetical protein
MRVVPKEQILKRLAAENPWWDSPHGIADDYDRLTPREYLSLFHPLVTEKKVRRAILLMGPRRIGKTVMLHHCVRQLIAEGVPPRTIVYVSVDHPLYNGLGLDEFLALATDATHHDFTRQGGYVVFDEIQYLRGWERHLKALVDSHRQLQCIASGSAAAALRLKSIESGAGRFTDFLLPPLTFHEYLGLLEKQGLVTEKDDELHSTDIDALNKAFVHYLNFGGYPEVLFAPAIQADPGRFIKADIIDKVLLRDLPSLYGISDIQELNALFTTLAYNTAGEVTLDGLSKNSGVAKNTIKRYVEYLQAAFLIRVVHRLGRDGRRFQRANYFKVYLTNPSMRAALFSPIGADDEAMGALAETGIMSQWFHSTFPVHYARWDKRGEKGEVDIVGRGWAVEVKWSDRYFERPDELRSLLAFCRSTRPSDVGVTTRTQAGVKTVDGQMIEFQPTSVYCYGVGRNMVRGKRWRAASPPALRTVEGKE